MLVQAGIQSLFKPIQVDGEVKAKPGAEALLKQAEYYSHSGPFKNEEKALTAYETIIRDYPQSKEAKSAYSGAGTIYLVTKQQYDKSTAMWEKAVELNPDKFNRETLTFSKCLGAAGSDVSARSDCAN